MHKDKIVGCVACNRDNPAKISLAFNKNCNDEIFFTTCYDSLKFENLCTLICDQKIDLLLIQKEQDFLIEKCTYVKIELIERSCLKENLKEFDDYFLSCAISALMNYLQKASTTFKQLFLSNRCCLISNEIQEIFNLINLTNTNYGKRKLKLDILQPLIFATDIKLRREKLLYFKQNPVLSITIEKILRKMPDIENIINFNYGCNNDINSCKKHIVSTYKIYKFIKLYHALREKCALFKFDHGSILNVFKEIFNSDIHDENQIDSLFNTGIDDYLDLAIKIYKETFEATQDYLKQIITELDCKIHKSSNNEFQFKFKLPINFEANYKNNERKLSTKDSFSNMNNFLNSKTSILDCTYTPTKSIEKKAINDLSSKEIFLPANDLEKKKNNLNINFKLPKEFILLNSKNNYVIVTTLELQKLNFKLSESYNQILEIGGELCKEILKECKNYRQKFYDFFDEISEIDLCLSSYKFSNKFDCCLPTISDKICIVSSYNPVINKEKVIYNDIYLSNLFRVNILMGSNMSGKSVYAKQILQIVVLNQIGYPIAAKNATIKLFKKIIFKSNHKTNVQEIINLIDNQYNDENTLLILDELNNGIHWETLVPLNIAIVKYLLIFQVYCLMITHNTDFIKFIKHLPGLNFLSSYKFMVTYGFNRNCKTIYSLIMQILNISLKYDEEDKCKDSNAIIKLAQQIQRRNTEKDEKYIIDQILQYNLFYYQ